MPTCPPATRTTHSRLMLALVAAIALVASTLALSSPGFGSAADAQTRNSGTSIDLFEITVTADQFDNFGNALIQFHGPDFDQSSLPVDDQGYPIFRNITAQRASTFLSPGLLLDRSIAVFTLPYDERYQSISYVIQSRDGTTVSAEGPLAWDDPTSIDTIDELNAQISFDIERLPAGPVGTDDTQEPAPTPPTSTPPTAAPPTATPPVPAPPTTDPNPFDTPITPEDIERVGSEQAAQQVIVFLFDNYVDPSALRGVLQDPDEVAGLIEVFRQTNIAFFGPNGGFAPILGVTFIEPGRVDVEVGAVTVPVERINDVWQLPTTSVCALLDFDDGPTLCTGDPLTPIADPCQAVFDSGGSVGGLNCDPNQIGVDPRAPVTIEVAEAGLDFDTMIASIEDGPAATAPYLQESDVVAGLLEVLRQSGGSNIGGGVAIEVAGGQLNEDGTVDLRITVAGFSVGEARMVNNGTNWQLTTPGLCTLMNTGVTLIGTPVEFCTGDPLTPVDNPCELASDPNVILTCDPALIAT